MKRASFAVLETTGDCQHIKPKGNSMKRKASILGALAVLAGLFLASAPASASTYICDNDTGPGTKFNFNNTEGNPRSDSITITHSGSDCEFGGLVPTEVAVTGDITINVTGGKVTLKKNLVSRDGKIKVTSSNSDVIAEGKVRAGGSIEILAGVTAGGSTGVIRLDQNMTSNLLQTGTGRGHILLRAQSTVRTQNIYTTGEGQPSPRTVADGQSVKTGGIQIDANIYNSTGDFLLGQSGSGSYVNGELDTRTTTGGDTSSLKMYGGVRITNGNSTSTGKITLTAMNKIKVHASQSRSGMIILNARNGTITLPDGTLDANGELYNNNGSQGYQAGGIGLFADTIQADNGTIVSASQNKHSSTGKTQRQIAIAANNIKFKGSSGLEIHADGNATSYSTRGSVYVYPRGGIVPTSNNSVTDFDWGSNIPNFSDPTGGIVKFDGTDGGSGTAPLVITADGFSNELRIAGYPIEFYGGAVTIHTRGQTLQPLTFLNQVNFAYTGSTGSADGVKFAGNGPVQIDANGVYADGTGNAGLVSFAVNKPLVVNSSFSGTTFAAAANGDGTNGSGGYVQITVPSFTLNSQATTILEAKGAHSGGIPSAPGDGGSVAVDSGAGFTVGSGNGNLNFSVAAGTVGNGGKLYLTGHPVSFSGTTGMTVSANGGMTFGDGGEINIFSHGGNITVNNTNANEVTFEAKAPADGSGGTVNIRFAANLTVSGARINVDSSSDGQGGLINLTDINTLSFEGASNILRANGSGSGKGGTINLGSENGVTLGTDAGEISLSAVGNLNNGTGNGGTISIISNSSVLPLTITKAHVDVSGGNGASGGNLSFIGASDVKLVGQFYVNGSGSGNGGSISVEAATAITLYDTQSEQQTATFQAKSGPDGGFGGSISLFSGENDPVDPTLLAADSFLATGKEGGGFVSIAHTGRFVILNHIVKVGVDDSVTDPGAYAGAIALNGITCQQWLSGSSSWPTAYWNCVNPFVPVTGDEIALTTAQGLPNGRKTELGNIKTHIYVMQDVDQYNSFFAESENPAGGLSFLEPDFPSDKIFNSAIFQRGDLPVLGNDYPFDAAWVHEIAAHELAHGVDEARGNTSITDQTYLTGLVKDRGFLDYVNGVGGTQKAPCSSNGTAPFDGLIDDLTKAAFCNGATLVSPNGIYDGLTNSQIAARSSSILEGSLHVYGHAFSYQHYVKNLSPLNYFNTTVDGLFEKGYFKCAQQVAAGLAGTTASSPFSYSCN